jgi:hypothetical protein
VPQGEDLIMTLPNPILSLMLSLLLLAGCATSTGPHVESGCPPGYVRVDNEDTGEYDCASQQDYEDIVDAMDERM